MSSGGMRSIRARMGRSRSCSQNTSATIPAETLPPRCTATRSRRSACSKCNTGPAEPPTTAPDTTQMHHNQKVLLDVLANDTGFIDAATVAIVSPPASGTASLNAQGRILYTHTTGAPAADSFTYRVSGPGGTSAPATVSVNFATTLRIANSNLNVPSQPPPTAFQLVPAFTTNPTFSQPLALAESARRHAAPVRLRKDGTAPRHRECHRRRTLRRPPCSICPRSLTPRGETLLSDGEQGLLSVAFHPNFATNRYFYVFYSVNAIPSRHYYAREFPACFALHHAGGKSARRRHRRPSWCSSSRKTRPAIIRAAASTSGPMATSTSRSATKAAATTTSTTARRSTATSSPRWRASTWTRSPAA